MTMTNSSQRGSKVGLIGLVIAFVGLAIALVVFLVNRRKKEQTTPEATATPETTATKPTKAEQRAIFNHIHDYALDNGFNNDAANTIAAVSTLETGRFSSNLVNKANNYFGMKSGGAGLGIQSGQFGAYASYDSLDDSIDDHLAWLRNKSYPFDENLTPEQHLQWMKSKKYFEAPLADYQKAVLSLINEFKA